MEQEKTTRTNSTTSIMSLPGVRERLHLLLDSPRWQLFIGRLPRYVNMALIIILLYFLAQLTWKIIPVPVLSSTAPNTRTVLPIPNKVSNTNKPQILNAQQINQWNLFGKDQPTSIKKPLPVAENLKEIQLNIQFTGIQFSVHPEESRAYILGTDAKEKTYKIGDMIPGNAKIENILADHMVLHYNNERVILKLRKKDPADKSKNPSVTNSNPHTTPNTIPNNNPNLAQPPPPTDIPEIPFQN